MVPAFDEGGVRGVIARRAFPGHGGWLAGRVRRRELSPVEVMDASIARIEADNERLNAFVYLRP